MTDQEDDSDEESSKEKWIDRLFDVLDLIFEILS